MSNFGTTSIPASAAANGFSLQENGAPKQRFTRRLEWSGVEPEAAQFGFCTRPVWRASARNIGQELFAGGARTLVEQMARTYWPSQT